MFKDEITLLKKENEKQSNLLKHEDNNIIKDIMKSISIFRVNSYDAQVIRRDLIGMAQELNLRDSGLEESIGNNLTEFTYEIIQNSNGPCKIEIFLRFLSKLSGYFFVWFTLFAFGAYGGLGWNVNPKLYILYIGFVLIAFITEGLITPLFSTEKGLKKELPPLISILSVFLLSFTLYPIDNSSSTNAINVKYIIGISGLIFLITRYFIMRNIHKLAKGKTNYIEDLR